MFSFVWPAKRPQIAAISENKKPAPWTIAKAFRLGKKIIDSVNSREAVILRVQVSLISSRRSGRAF